MYFYCLISVSSLVLSFYWVTLSFQFCLYYINAVGHLRVHWLFQPKFTNTLHLHSTFSIWVTHFNSVGLNKIYLAVSTLPRQFFWVWVHLVLYQFNRILVFLGPISIFASVCKGCSSHFMFCTTVFFQCVSLVQSFYNILYFWVISHLSHGIHGGILIRYLMFHCGPWPIPLY